MYSWNNNGNNGLPSVFIKVVVCVTVVMRVEACIPASSSNYVSEFETNLLCLTQ